MRRLEGDLIEAAARLYSYLKTTHWDGRALIGPDPGVRFNARIWRFLKSYTRWVDWNDSIAYIQAQKYWISCNTVLGDSGLADSTETEAIAKECGRFLLDSQHRDGYWLHPNKEWQGRIATVEGNYGAMGLINVYLRWGEQEFLEGAKRWYEYAVTAIGLRTGDAFSAINYFANSGAGSVPNVTVSSMRTFALLAKATGEDGYLQHCDAMVRWLNHVQRETGEIPYHTIGPDGSGEERRVHFLCYQYNAFELVNLMDYYELTHDSNVWGLMERLAQFVTAGVLDNGACRYNCSQDKPEVSYYGAASAAALTRAASMGIGDYASKGELGYRRLLSHQRHDGSMKFYSRGNYGVLSDSRSYPRYLAMTLYLMLMGAGIREPITKMP